MKVKKGDRVLVDYEGRFEDGEVFDTSNHGDHSHPLEFVAGDGQVIKGFDDAVIGMAEGEEKEFTIKPEEAYGERNETLTQKIPRRLIPENHKLEAGMTLVMQSPEGHMPVKIKDLDNQHVTIDLNHPLAGKTLIFKIKLIGINKPSQHDHGHDHGHEHSHSHQH